MSEGLSDWEDGHDGEPTQEDLREEIRKVSRRVGVPVGYGDPVADSSIGPGRFRGWTTRRRWDKDVDKGWGNLSPAEQEEARSKGVTYVGKVNGVAVAWFQLPDGTLWDPWGKHPKKDPRVKVAS